MLSKHHKPAIIMLSKHHKPAIIMLSKHHKPAIIMLSKQHHISIKKPSKLHKKNHQYPFKNSISMTLQMPSTSSPFTRVCEPAALRTHRYVNFAPWAISVACYPNAIHIPSKHHKPAIIMLSKHHKPAIIMLSKQHHISIKKPSKLHKKKPSISIQKLYLHDSPNTLYCALSVHLFHHSRKIPRKFSLHSQTKNHPKSLLMIQIPAFH